MVWTKKCMCGPFKKLIALLKAQENVITVMEDKYGTSKCCCRCDKWSLDTRECRQRPKDLEPMQHLAKEVVDWQPPIAALSETPWRKQLDWQAPLVTPTKEPWFMRWCFNQLYPINRVHRDVNAAKNML